MSIATLAICQKNLLKHPMHMFRQMSPNLQLLDPELSQNQQAVMSDGLSITASWPLEISMSYFFGENHFHTALLEDIGRNAAALYGVGARALLVEASSDQDFSDLNSGDFRRLDAGALDVGPILPQLRSLEGLEDLGGTDPIAAARNNMIKALVAQGIAIVPMDSARYRAESKARIEARIQGQTPPVATVSQVDREADIADNIDAAVARYGKVINLIGMAHTRRGIMTYGHGQQIKTSGQVAIDHGHRVRTVHFYGASFYDGDARQPLSYLTANGWGDQKYMYEPGADDPLAGEANGSPDWIVYVPPAQFERQYAPTICNSEAGVYPLLQPGQAS